MPSPPFARDILLPRAAPDQSISSPDGFFTAEATAMRREDRSRLFLRADYAAIMSCRRGFSTTFLRAARTYSIQYAVIFPKSHQPRRQTVHKCCSEMSILRLLRRRLFIFLLRFSCSAHFCRLLECHGTLYAIINMVCRRFRRCDFTRYSPFIIFFIARFAPRPFLSASSLPIILRRHVHAT